MDRFDSNRYLFNCNNVTFDLRTGIPKEHKPEDFLTKISPVDYDPDARSEDIARLVGIRFANITEPSRGLVLNATQIKNMTGNDTLNARFLNENSFDFESQFKLYINTNYLPVISDMTIIAGYRILQEEGFKQPSSVTAAISAYQYESDKLAQFAEERLMANASK